MLTPQGKEVLHPPVSRNRHRNKWRRSENVARAIDSKSPEPRVSSPGTSTILTSFVHLPHPPTSPLEGGNQKAAPLPQSPSKKRESTSSPLAFNSWRVKEAARCFQLTQFPPLTQAVLLPSHQHTERSLRNFSQAEVRQVSNQSYSSTPTVSPFIRQ